MSVLFLSSFVPEKMLTTFRCLADDTIYAVMLLCRSRANL